MPLRGSERRRPPPHAVSHPATWRRYSLGPVPPVAPRLRARKRPRKARLVIDGVQHRILAGELNANVVDLDPRVLPRRPEAREDVVPAAPPRAERHAQLAVGEQATEADLGERTLVRIAKAKYPSRTLPDVRTEALSVYVVPALRRTLWLMPFHPTEFRARGVVRAGEAEAAAEVDAGSAFRDPRRADVAAALPSSPPSWTTLLHTASAGVARTREEARDSASRIGRRCRPCPRPTGSLPWLLLRVSNCRPADSPSSSRRVGSARSSFAPRSRPSGVEPACARPARCS